MRAFEEYHEAVISEALDHLQNLRKLKERFFGKGKATERSSVVFPPRESLFSPREVPGPKAPELPPKEKEEYSYHSEEEEKDEKDELRSSFSSSFSSPSSFIADSSEEPIVYSEKVMNDALAKELPKSGQKRTRALATRWSPGIHRKDPKDSEVILLEDDDDEHDLEEYREFLKAVEDFGFKTAVDAMFWYRSKFGKPLSGITDNLGRGDAEPKRIFNLILNGNHAKLESKRQGGPGNKICVLCGYNKPCPNTLWVEEDDGNTYSYPIARNCAKLAYAAIQFIDAISRGESLQKCNTLFADVQEAHAEKGKVY